MVQDLTANKWESGWSHQTTSGHRSCGPWARPMLFSFLPQHLQRDSFFHSAASLTTLDLPDRYLPLPLCHGILATQSKRQPGLPCNLHCVQPTPYAQGPLLVRVSQPGMFLCRIATDTSANQDTRWKMENAESHP